MSKRMIDSELIEALSNDIKFDGMGNVIVSKNLVVDGDTKLNGGFEREPIYSYSDNAGNIFNIYSEINDNAGYTFFGDMNSTNIGIGYYTLDASDNIDTINFLVMDNDGLSVYTGQDNYQQFVDIYKLIDELNKKQNKLYRHKITLNGIYVLMYNSTSNLNVGSVDNLRTIMEVSSNSDRQVLPVCTEDGTAVAPLAVTIHYCKVGGTDVTSVSDTVTTL